MKTNKLIVVTEKYSCVVPLKNKWDFPKEKFISLVQNAEAFKNDKVLDVADAHFYHICEYCGEIAQGTDEDVLCQDCRMTFGHAFYSEL